MSNSYFQFKQFTIEQEKCAMKVTTDACLFGAWCAKEINSSDPITIGIKIESLLDIGAGTGLLSLLMVQQNNMHIDAVEIDKDAFEQAKNNVQSSPWKKKIKIFNENILSFKNKKKYDCIIANPPFFENELLSPDQNKNVSHHSSQLKIAEVLAVILEKLTDKGIFFLLVPYKRNKEIENLLLINQLFILKKIIVRQSAVHQPFRIMLMGKKEKTSNPIVSEIAICTENKEYSFEFTELLKPYYLYL